MLTKLRHDNITYWLLGLWLTLAPFSIAVAKLNFVLDGTEDPELRSLIYAYQTQPSLNALIHINTALELTPKLKQERALILILAELNIDHDQLTTAQSLLSNNLRESEYEQEKNKLLLKLADKYYQQKNFTKSRDTLKKVNNNLSDASAEQRQLQEGMTALALGEYAQAAKFFSNITGKSTQGSYAQYNLGIALLKRKKMHDGIQELKQLGERNVSSEELKDLKDYANINLGFLYMRGKEYKLAKEYLQRVRLNAKLSNQALFGMGWIDILNKDHKEALVPLFELHSRPVFDAAVVESYLAVPHALVIAGSDKQALDFYEQAVNLFERQKNASAETLAALQQSPQAIDDMVAPDKQFDIADSRDALLARVTQALFDNAVFSVTTANYAKLKEMRNEIPDWLNAYQTQPNATQLPVEKNQLDRQVADFRNQIDDAITKHQQLLSDIVQNELRKEHDKMDRYLNQARFAMAQIYDRILNQRTTP